MKCKLNFIPRVLFVFTILAAIFVYYLSISAQNQIEADNAPIPPPSKEEFQKTDALAVPWRSSGCHTYFVNNAPDCHQVTDKEWFGMHTLTLYDENASVWYKFSISPDSPDHFLEKKNKDFLPFATAPTSFPDIVILRLIGESPHWYKVEVNEETQATKYILKSDPMWAKTSWNYWLFYRGSVGVDFEKTPLYDKPDGQVIDGAVGGTYIAAMMVKTDGNWAYVRTSGSVMEYSKIYEGWVRWRKGRKILAKLVFDVAGGLPSTTSGK